jgi:hypothetical protein
VFSAWLFATVTREQRLEARVADPGNTVDVWLRQALRKSCATEQRDAATHTGLCLERESPATRDDAKRVLWRNLDPLIMLALLHRFTNLF